MWLDGRGTRPGCARSPDNKSVVSVKSFEPPRLQCLHLYMKEFPQIHDSQLFRSLGPSSIAVFPYGLACHCGDTSQWPGEGERAWHWKSFNKSP